MADTQTISVYDQRAKAYADRFSTAAAFPRLEAFLNTLPQGAFVLDLGCGPGRASARMIERGFGVDAVDASEAMVRLALERYGVEARLAGFDDIEGREVYDAVWASFSLLHASKGAFPGYLAALYRSLKPGGQFYIGMKLGEGERRDKLGRFYSYYSEGELTDALEEAGFAILTKDTGSDAGLDGTVSDWMIITAEK